MAVALISESDACLAGLLRYRWTMLGESCLGGWEKEGCDLVVQKGL